MEVSLEYSENDKLAQEIAIVLMEMEQYICKERHREDRF